MFFFWGVVFVVMGDGVVRDAGGCVVSFDCFYGDIFQVGAVCDLLSLMYWNKYVVDSGALFGIGVCPCACWSSVYVKCGGGKHGIFGHERV